VLRFAISCITTLPFRREKSHRLDGFATEDLVLRIKTNDKRSSK